MVFSVGGEGGQWGNVFLSNQTKLNFANSAAQILSQFNLDGIDFDLENY